MNELYAALLGAIIGGLLTFLGELIYRKRDEKSKQQHSASILYNDLKSIQKYFNKESSDVVNIRYTDEWQSYVANCGFLNNHEIALLYGIYDSVYDYNQVFDEGPYFHVEEQPVDQIFRKLSGNINHQDFKELMDALKTNLDK